MDFASRDELLARFRAAHGLEDLPDEDLELALSHRSYGSEAVLPDNERLEFLGDAVIGAIASEHLYLASPDADEGELSKVRAALVSRDSLGTRAEAMGIGPLLLLGVGEARTGGARRPSVLGGALEALVGAIHLRLGHDRAREFTLAHVVLPLLAERRGTRDPHHGDFKTAIQERTQSLGLGVPSYRIVEESGPDHAKFFRVALEVQGRRLAIGEGSRIKYAQNDAARLALADLDRRDGAE